MAPLPANSTATLFVDYSCCGFQHTIQARYNASGSANDAMNVVDALLTALDTTIFLVSIDGARVRDLGTNVTYPITWTGAATYGTGAGTVGQTAWFFHFVGRSIGGRRNRITVFGAQVVTDPADDNYRITTANAAIAAAIAALEADPNTPCSIDGATTNWHQYANIGVNAYWRNHVR